MTGIENVESVGTVVMCKGSTAAPEADPSRDKYLLADLMKLLKSDQIATSRRFTVTAEAQRFEINIIDALLEASNPGGSSRLHPSSPSRSNRRSVHTSTNRGHNHEVWRQSRQ
jgi:hypothetical protein